MRRSENAQSKSCSAAWICRHPSHALSRPIVTRRGHHTIVSNNCELRERPGARRSARLPATRRSRTRTADTHGISNVKNARACDLLRRYTVCLVPCTRYQINRHVIRIPYSLAELPRRGGGASAESAMRGSVAHRRHHRTHQAERQEPGPWPCSRPPLSCASMPSAQRKPTSEPRACRVFTARASRGPRRRRRRT